MKAVKLPLACQRRSQYYWRPTIRQLSSSHRSFHPSDLTGFSGMSTLHLIGVSVFYKLVSWRSFVDTVTNLLTDKRLNHGIVVKALKQSIKFTVFKFFTGGETFHECENSVISLKKHHNVNTILDHSTEESESEGAMDSNLKCKIELLHEISASRVSSHVKFIPIKLTALVSSKVLETITKFQESNSSSSSSHRTGAKRIEDILNEDELIAYHAGISRIKQLCSVCRTLQIGILLDAEQSFRQPGIEYMYKAIAREFNKVNPVIWNTYQMYLTRTTTALQDDLNEAKKDGYILACKLVRGAYMKSETNKAKECSYTNPLCSSKDTTDENYNRAIEQLVNEISTSDSKSISVFVATHNRQSIDYTIELMKKHNLPSHHDAIHFAQIKGMSDHITYALGQGKYNTYKLVPYGAFEEILPWLLRRLDENQDIFGAMQRELHLYNAELRRRLRLF